MLTPGLRRPPIKCLPEVPRSLLVSSNGAPQTWGLGPSTKKIWHTYITRELLVENREEGVKIQDQKSRWRVK